MPIITASMRSNALKTAGLAAILFGVNFYVARELFSIEYTWHMGSIEATHITIARYAAENSRNLDWWPLWYTGIPYQNTYPPILHLIVAAVAVLSGASAALSYHAVTAAFYCLGPVTLFWMAYRLTGLRAYSFAAGLLYSVFSPSTLLIPAVRDDIGGIFNPRRLHALVHYGEGPHIASMALLPVAVVCLDLALRKRRPVYYFASALSFASVVLTNWLGGFALAAALAACLLSRIGQVRAWLTASAVGLCAYVIACPWIPPSTLNVIRRNSQHMGGDYAITLHHLKYVGLLLVLLALVEIWFERRKFSEFFKFALLFSIFMAAITLASAYWGISLLPQPQRYHLEMEMALVLVIAFGMKPVLDRASGRQRAIVALGFVLFCFFQMKTYRGFAAWMDGPIDIRTTSEYKTAMWFDGHMRDRRVMAGGSTGFWLNVFTDTPQLAGGFEQGILNRHLPAAIYQIQSGAGAGPHEAEYALLWMKVYGVNAVAVSGPGSTEQFKPFANPAKFEGLNVLWRDGGDFIYEVPQRSASLAHVIPRTRMIAREPESGLDVDPLRPYVAALDDPGLPPADFRWTDRRHARISAELQKDQGLSVQITYHPGWKAYVGGRPRRVYRDKIGLLAVEPDCEGRCTVELAYDGGIEMLVARLLSWSALLGGAGWTVAAAINERRRKHARAVVSSQPDLRPLSR